ncbi:MAG: class E sortase [Acidimicrobiia bacterium]
MTTSASPAGRVGRARTALLTASAGLALTALTVVGVGATPAPSGPVAHGVLPQTASSHEPPRLQRAGAASDATSTTSTTSTTTPAPAPPSDTLLTPEDVPDPSVIRPISIVGRIQIPKIGLDAELRDQITQQSIDLGPSHWPGTALPGGYGNAVIAGHRNSHTAPFHDTASLTVGDAITLVDAAGRAFTYHVTEMFVVDPSAVWITEQKPGHTLTLFTCHPLGSSAQRLVIRATLD